MNSKENAAGSLNEGVELDNELVDQNKEDGKTLDKALFGNVTPGELPELKENLDVDALVTKVRALDYAQNNLSEIGGINQQLALESFHLAPGLITDEVSIGFYTQDISKTRYKFAMEAIENEKKSVFAEIIAKIVNFFKAAIAKLAEWFQRCKAAIVKFFKDRKIVPAEVAKRFALIARSVSGKTDELTSGMGERDRNILAEVFDAEYGSAFMAVCKDCLEIKDKAGDLAKFSANGEFFSALKDKANNLKTMNASVHEKAEETVSKALSSSASSDNIARIAAIFNEINAAHEANVQFLTKVLNELQSEVAKPADGADPATKANTSVKLLSDVIQAEVFIVGKADAYMHVVSDLMSKISKRNLKKVPIIQH